MCPFSRNSNWDGEMPGNKYSGQPNGEINESHITPEQSHTCGLEFNAFLCYTKNNVIIEGSPNPL